MGVLDFILKKKKKTNKKQAVEDAKLEQTISNTYQQKNSSKDALMMESIAVEQPQVYSPSVEHPLLTIQDRMTKLEEIYKSLNDRIIIIDGKVATKQDVDDLKSMLHEDLMQGDRMLSGIENLGNRLDSLRKVRDELTRQVDTSKDELTRKETVLDQVKTEIELMECDEKILEALSKGDASTIELSEKLDLTRQYIWGRLKELQSADYVKSVKSGRQTKYHLLKKN